MPRIRTLTDNEQESFDRLPAFDRRVRKKFFDFPKSLLTIAATMRNSDYQIRFLVSCGYLRATRRFFVALDFLGLTPFNETVVDALARCFVLRSDGAHLPCRAGT